MKVITIKEPYASLIIEGYKEYEFRTRKTSYRGEIYIHTSIQSDKNAIEKYKNLNIKYNPGYIIGRVDITDCILVDDEFKEVLRKKNSNHIYDNILKEEGKIYAFKVENNTRVKPIKTKGKLSIWNYEN
ncbi:MAG TPA: ASCH domain-containing protein [Bacilli bacterium]|nr:ASCH domain-containing protein [Bacilli bacterium]